MEKVEAIRSRSNLVKPKTADEQTRQTNKHTHSTSI